MNSEQDTIHVYIPPCHVRGYVVIFDIHVQEMCSWLKLQGVQIVLSNRVYLLHLRSTLNFYLFWGFDRETVPVDLLIQWVVKKGRLGHRAEQFVGFRQRSPTGTSFGPLLGGLGSAVRSTRSCFLLPTFPFLVRVAAITAIAQIIVAGEETEGARLLFVRHFTGVTKILANIELLT